MSTLLMAPAAAITSALEKRKTKNENPIGDLPVAPPRASVVIVSFNSRAYLERCLTSVLETMGADCEVIIVDNASTDGSADFVAARFPEVTLIRSTVNAGFAAGNNRGVAAARGSFIVGLNPDTEVTPGWLSALLAPLEAAQSDPHGPRVGLTTPRILMAGPSSPSGESELVNTCGNRMHYTGLTLCRGFGLPATAPELAWPAAVAAVSGACFALPRTLWEKLGGFDETFFTYLEDTDLSLRARLAGYTCLYVPEAVVYHHYTNSFSAAKLYYLERNRWVLLLKSYRPGTLLLLLPGLLLAETITWGYALTRGRAGLWAKARAYGWLLAHPRLVLHKRRQTQQLRRAADHELLGALAWPLDISQLAGPALGRFGARILNPLFRLWYTAARAWRLA